MSGGTARLILAELRRKTDRELLVLVRTEIERSLDLAACGYVSAARERLDKAESLLAVTRAPAGQLTELETRLVEAQAVIARFGTERAACA